MRGLFFVVLVTSSVLLAACQDPLRGEIDATADATSPENALVENRGAGKDNWWDNLPRAAWDRYERVPLASEWFEVYLIRDGIYAIYEPGQFEEVISFLITGEERALLFDTGLGIGDIRSIVSALTELEIIVLNSHSHYDHIGGNHQFDRVLGLDTDYSRRHESGGRPEDVAEFVGPGWIWKALPAGFDPAAYRSRPYEVSERIADGDTIELGGRTLEVIETPGHAPDSLCLIDRDNRLLLTGDTFYLAPLYTHLEGSDFARYSDSAARLAALAGDVDDLLTAHNVPVVESRYLVRMHEAFQTIASGRGEYELADGHREYDFGDFSVIVVDQDFQ